MTKMASYVFKADYILKRNVVGRFRGEHACIFRCCSRVYVGTTFWLTLLAAEPVVILVFKHYIQINNNNRKNASNDYWFIFVRCTLCGVDTTIRQVDVRISSLAASNCCVLLIVCVWCIHYVCMRSNGLLLCFVVVANGEKCIAQHNKKSMHAHCTHTHH